MCLLTTESRQEREVFVDLIQGKAMNSRYDLHNLVIDWNETGVPLDPPTKQERRVMYLLIQGITSNTEIGAWLCITPDTASQHIDHLRAKFGAKSRAQLVAYLFHSILITLLGDIPQSERSLYEIEK